MQSPFKSHWRALAPLSLLLIAGCGGHASSDRPYLSYAGSGSVILAWADPTRQIYAVAPLGSYAGKRQYQRGTVDPMSGKDTGQLAGIEIYKGLGGHVFGLSLSARNPPAARQISSETGATLDDACSFTGISVPGADTGYAGVFFAADIKSPTNSSYFYRLPGADGVCNTDDDVVHLVKTGMSPGDAPIVAPAMPSAAVFSAQGAITGFVAKSGTDLLLYDNAMSHPVVLASFPSPIVVATALPNGLLQGYASGQLFAIDGRIVYVDYAAHSVSAPLYTLPDWTPLDNAARFAASPDSLYVAVNRPAEGESPPSVEVLRMPADGSAPPTLLSAMAGRAVELEFPVAAHALIVASVDTGYSIQAYPEGGGAATTLLSSPQNSGRYTATAAAVYYTTWATSTVGNVVTRSGTSSGIVGVDASVIQAPLANSTFATGGEAQAWVAGDVLARQTPYITLFQVTGLTPVQVVEPVTGRVFIADGVSGGSLRAIDAVSQLAGATLGTLPVSTATLLGGTFRSGDHVGFLEATTYASTQSPATRDLYLLKAQQAHSLLRLSSSL